MTRRADRLFQIVQYLRGKQPVTARTLAEKLAVSERTIYRDIQDLSLSGVPVLGEAGSGYRLLAGFDLPPLMFTQEELTALLLGARMVQGWSDQGLSEAAEHALSKIESVLPMHLRDELVRPELIVPNDVQDQEVTGRLAVVRRAVRDKYKLDLTYTRADGMQSERVIRPLGMAYWGRVWTMVTWCELRESFRDFRLDRIRSLQVRNERFCDEPGMTLRDFYLTLAENEKL